MGGGDPITGIGKGSSGSSETEAETITGKSGGGDDRTNGGFQFPNGLGEDTGVGQGGELGRWIHRCPYHGHLTG